MIEDGLLLWRFKNGNEDALCRIYEKYRTRLLKLANALSNDKELADDVVQDVFVSFAQSTVTIFIMYSDIQPLSRRFMGGEGKL